MQSRDLDARHGVSCLSFELLNLDDKCNSERETFGIVRDGRAECTKGVLIIVTSDCCFALLNGFGKISGSLIRDDCKRSVLLRNAEKPEYAKCYKKKVF